MSVYEDFVHFVDDGSKVPYFMNDVKFTVKPKIIHHQFEYEFKIFYKSFNSYYVGVDFSQFVRSIRSSDFKMMLELYEQKNITMSKAKQLVFDF